MAEDLAVEVGLAAVVAAVVGDQGGVAQQVGVAGPPLQGRVDQGVGIPGEVDVGVNGPGDGQGGPADADQLLEAGAVGLQGTPGEVDRLVGPSLAGPDEAEQPGVGRPVVGQLDGQAVGDLQGLGATVLEQPLAGGAGQGGRAGELPRAATASASAAGASSGPARRAMSSARNAASTGSPGW